MYLHIQNTVYMRTILHKSTNNIIIIVPREPRGFICTIPIHKAN